jgi:hypothetical protein
MALFIRLAIMVGIALVALFLLFLLLKIAIAAVIIAAVIFAGLVAVNYFRRRMGKAEIALPTRR